VPEDFGVRQFPPGVWRVGHRARPVTSKRLQFRLQSAVRRRILSCNSLKELVPPGGSGDLYTQRLNGDFLVRPAAYTLGARGLGVGSLIAGI